VTEPTWTTTRSQLTDALAAIELRPVLLPGRGAGNVNAESMAEAILAQLPQDASTFTEYAVAWGGEDPNECAGIEECDDEAGAEEMTQWIIGGYVARRTVACSRWERVSAAAGAATGGPGHGETGHGEAGHVNAVPEGAQSREPPPHLGHFGGF
jgi:hypothetical protein